MSFAFNSRDAIRSRLVALAVLGIMAVFAMPASASSSYSVICKHGKYDIDSRSEAQLKIAFGSSACIIRSFGFRSDAENYAKRNNMQPGQSCSCR